MSTNPPDVSQTPPIAYIGGLDHQLLRDLALHTNIPLVDARRPAAVRIDPGI